MERIGPARIQEILNNGQRAHPRKDFEIEDEGVLHLEHNLQCAVCFDRPQKTMFLPCLHFGCCTECAERLNKYPFCRKDIFLL